MNAITKIIREHPGTDGITFIYHLFTNVYIIESEEGLIIVDTGVSGNTRKILRAIRILGYKHSDVKYIILTHAHLDHFGCAQALKNKTSGLVLGHRADVEYFEKGGIGAMPKILPNESKLNLLFQGKVLGAPPVIIDRPLEDGDIVGEWQIIHTPGHTPGTISLYSKKRRLLITGGWAIPRKSQIEKSKYENPFVGYISSDPDQLTSSRLKLANLDFDTLLCSHFPPRLFPVFSRLIHSMKK
jgi:hydroxyacylglutathione hydrolase